MNFEIYLHKIKHFVNARAEIHTFGEYEYLQREPGLFLFSFLNEKGKLCSLSRWLDFLPEGEFNNVMTKENLTDDEIYAVELFLSRLGYLFQIDNRQRIDKDIFILYYLKQLVSLKNSNVPNKLKSQNFFLRFLCFELGMDYDSYSLFHISEEGVCLKTKNRKSIPIIYLLDVFYTSLKKEKYKYSAAKIKRFQMNTLSLLAERDNKDYTLPFDDVNVSLVEPNLFIKAFKRPSKNVCKVLTECFDKYQSTINLLVSNFILMNYSYYIISKKPSKLLMLKKNIDDEVFSNILSTIVYRGVFVDRRKISQLGIDDYINLPERSSHKLFNLIYAV
ncbi:hypothetical protein RBA29_004093 [Cronobacter turicensis]|nr:hypothetical protein [Cronobacter turicensis]EKY3217599.1 hypothetical protein [Cronobacter turicensis]